MEFTLSKVEEIPVRTIQGNNVLAISVGSRELERCEKTIREYGLISPIVVRKCEDGHYQVIAGECERMVVSRMRQSTIQAVVMERLEAPEATRLALLLSSLKQSSNALSEGLLLKELCLGCNHTQTEVAMMVGRSVSWVNKRLALVERLATSVVNLVRAGQLCAHTAQEIARMPGNVQQPFANKVVKDHLPKSVVERLVTTYNNPQTPLEVKRAVLENPRDTLEWLAGTERIHSSKQRDGTVPTSLSLQKLRNILQMLFRLTGEAEGLLVTLPAEDKHVLLPMLRQCSQALWRFTQLAKTSWEDFSPGKNQSEEVEVHGH